MYLLYTIILRVFFLFFIPPPPVYFLPRSNRKSPSKSLGKYKFSRQNRLVQPHKLTHINNERGVTINSSMVYCGEEFLRWHHFVISEGK